MKSLDASTVRHAVEARAQRLITFRSRKHAADERTQIEAGPSNDDRQTAACGDVSRGGGRIRPVSRRRIHLGWLDHVDEVVRNAAALSGVELVGADVEAAIDDRRIAANDLAVEGLGNGERQGALAAGRWANDRDEPHQGVSRTGSL